MEFIELLLSCGADASFTDNDGLPPNQWGSNEEANNLLQEAFKIRLFIQEKKKENNVNHPNNAINAESVENIVSNSATPNSRIGPTRAEPALGQLIEI
jgi:hypothetical protein